MNDGWWVFAGGEGGGGKLEQWEKAFHIQPLKQYSTKTDMLN